VNRVSARLDRGVFGGSEVPALSRGRKAGVSRGVDERLLS
jgi:hypothetical protein